MKYDAIIIGSGQGGNPLAYRLADAHREKESGRHMHQRRMHPH